MKSYITLFCAISAVALVGCNTIAGAGKDVASGGQAIQNASREVRAEWREASNRNEHEYEAARKTCAGTNGASYDACINDAHAEYSSRMKDARNSYHRSDMRAASDEDRREDSYDAAREKCEVLRGTDEDRCIADARSHYHG